MQLKFVLEQRHLVLNVTMIYCRNQLEVSLLTILDELNVYSLLKGNQLMRILRGLLATNTSAIGIIYVYDAFYFFRFVLFSRLYILFEYQ